MIKNYFTYYSQKYGSKWLVLAIDLFSVVIPFLLAYLIRFNFTLNFDKTQLLVQLPIILFITSISFLSIGSNKSVIRYTGLTDVINLYKSVTLMTFMAIFFSGL